MLKYILAFSLDEVPMLQSVLEPIPLEKIV